MFNRRLPARWQQQDLLSTAKASGGNLPGIAPELLLGANYGLDRQPKRAGCIVIVNVNLFQRLKKCAATVPWHALTLRNNVVALECANGDKSHVRELKWRSELQKTSLVFFKYFLAEAHKVHFVERDQDGANSKQPRDVSMPASLRKHAFARIHEQNCNLRCRSSGDHVASVLFVSRRIGYDELAPRRGKIAVGNINRDSLFALGL